MVNTNMVLDFLPARRFTLAVAWNQIHMQSCPILHKAVHPDLELQCLHVVTNENPHLVHSQARLQPKTKFNDALALLVLQNGHNGRWNKVQGGRVLRIREKGVVGSIGGHILIDRSHRNKWRGLRLPMLANTLRAGVGAFTTCTLLSSARGSATHK